jgi:chlorobactene glucosyltransferase
MLLSSVLLNTLLVAALAGLTFAFYAFLRPVPRSRLDECELPFVSIVVPARNEEKKIERCLQSLRMQNYPHFEIVVIDDRSTDRTAEIIERMAALDSRIKFVQGKNLPDGWIGKCNALVHAVGYASGEWLVFTDADTWHSTNSIRDSVSYAIANRADLISFVPVQELGSFWERLIMPVLLGSFLCGDPFHTVNDPESGRAYAYGQYVLARRSAYLASGGHQRIRDEIVEDHALGRLFKSNGYRILVGDGRDLYKVRMYTGLESLWQGWTKNLYSLIECRPVNLLIVLSLINCAALVPFLQLFAVAGLWLGGSPDEHREQASALLAVQLLIMMAWYRRTTDHYDGVGWRNFFLLPLGSIAVTVLYLHSAYLVIAGREVNWKGRRYKVRTTKTIEAAEPALAPVLDKPLDPALENSD